MLVTGVLLFVSEAVKCYYNTSFWVKIITLPFALAVHLPGCAIKVASDPDVTSNFHAEPKMVATASLDRALVHGGRGGAVDWVFVTPGRLAPEPKSA